MAIEGFENYRVEEMIYSDRKAVIIYPNCMPKGRMLLKTEYISAFPNFDIAMLEKGYYVIHVFQRNRWAPDEEIDILADFVRYCAKQLGASKRCVLEGMSAGGYQAAIFAERYPELTAILYMDAPVLNLLSMCGLGECTHPAVPVVWREVAATYGVNRSTIINFRKSPIDNMEPLIANNIPVIMLYGDADDGVIYEENGKVLEQFYAERGGILKVICKSMTGHHPHGLEDPTPIIEFVERHNK